MYDVVTDIGNYKYFLPFCKKSDILTREESKLSAYLEIGFPPVMESYISDVTFQRPHVTSAVCHDGRLFTYLVTTWKFNPGLRSNANSSIVDFAVDFEFKSFFHSNLANMFFDRLVKQMENAFLVEAKRRYGKESVPTHKPISVSKNNQEVVAVAKGNQNCPPAKTQTENWINYGFHNKEKKTDRLHFHLNFFGSITVCLVFVGYGLFYAPDVNLRNWSQREAFIELKRREVAGLPLISPDIIDPSQIKLPSEEELEGVEVII
ncbi:hypothetical protein FQA39_LY06672 [Lamprigera yunnana]|nr:hypothetical protein FQA39_LY06672 [Lamprigera yunnana]